MPSSAKSLWELLAAGPQPVADLVDTPELLLAIRSFAPGADFPAHRHETYDEVFIGLKGTLTVWLDGLRRELGPGDVVVCPRQHEHYVLNSSRDSATIAVVKSPNTPGDSLPGDRRPGANP